MKFIFLLALTIAIASCTNEGGDAAEPEKETTSTEPAENDETSDVEIIEPYKAPSSFVVLKETVGDLDGDGIEEKAIVFNSPTITEFGTVRELHILKKHRDEWILWKSSKNAIRKSEEGGVMGDPFDDISIKKGILIINHFGGSRWKWAYVDKYRFQNNEFELIGYTYTSGAPCEFWEDFEFNLSTGQIHYKKQYESCDDDDTPKLGDLEKEEFVKKGVSINLNNKHIKEEKIISPKHNAEIYI